MELREKIARAVSKWPLHLDGFAPDQIYSTALLRQWRERAFAQADEILALFDQHDSDCATHNEPALPNGPCDCSLSG